TGRQVNADMEFYKLGGIQDIPRIHVEIMDMPERGVIGIGEPPTISTAAAIGNAVFNAIGARVPFLPLTPQHVLAALAKKHAWFANITRGETGYGIGAMVKLAAIAENEELRRNFPALTGAAGQIGGPQIRNMGTLGGNLCQRNRCWYFRDEHVVCLLKGGRKCYATDGENQYHAIFTKGHPCVIVHPSTLAPALIALGATAEVQGPKGKR